MTTYSTPSLSSLELMLEKIQQLENEPKDVPPPLPARPVSKARLPPRPKRLLPNSLQRIGAEDSEQKTATSSSKIGMLDSKDTVDAYASKSAEEQIQIDGLKHTREGKAMVLQRCFRAYQARCFYNELKSSVISLQSFIRGENTRNAYQHMVARLKHSLTMQKQMKLYFQNDGFQGQHTAIIYLQSGIRGWLTRRHRKYIEIKKNLPDEKTKAKQVHGKNNTDTKDHTRVSYSFLVNLQRQVLRTEAAVRNVEAESVALRKHINQYEKRWMEYEAKMKSMEKMWQDQLTSMQISLASAKKGLVAEKTTTKSQRVEASPEIKPTRNGKSTEMETPCRSSLEKFSDLPNTAEPQINSRTNSISDINEHNIVLNDDDGNLFQVKSGCWNTNIDVGTEFQKLEHKFDAWKEDYKIRLEEAKATMKKLAQAKTENSKKRWWRRQR